MDYSKTYNNIIENAKSENESRKLAKTNGDYFENHHIVPKCMGGTNDHDNMVLLTAREHFICHWLLVKIYEDDLIVYKLASAFHKMCRVNKTSGTRKREYSKSSRLYKYARQLWIDNHPCKSPEVKKKISETLKLHYKNNPTIKLYETRVCKCGCGNEFTCRDISKQQYVRGHTGRNHFDKISKSLSNTLSNFTRDEMKYRLDNSLRNCDHVKRGESISKGKKGKKTDQLKIMGERFANMSDKEFELYLQTKSHYVHKRYTNLRDKFINERDDN